MPSGSNHQVAVTGYGSVTALGGDSSTMWEALLEGRSARAPISSIPLEGCRVTEGAEAVLPDLPGFSKKQISRLSRSSRLLLPAVAEALKQAGLLDEEGRSLLNRLEMCVSTTACGMEKGEEFLRRIWQADTQGNGALLAHYQAQQQIAEIQSNFGFRGPAMIIANACAGGANAIGHGADLIRSGMADIVLAGGYDALCELVYAGFDSLQSLAPEACRPFDRGRNGLMLGEGAAFLVLENLERARCREAPVHALISGYGHTTDCHHLTQPDQEGIPLEKAMGQALDMSGISARDIGYVNAHGTGTPFNDGAEAKAFERVFGRHSTRLSSTKAALGHTLGAAGAIEAVISLLALKSGALPPQINIADPEPLVADALVGPNESTDLRHVMSVNLGFGGSNAALILSKETLI